jgi:hypothetical protein
MRPSLRVLLALPLLVGAALVAASASEPTRHVPVYLGLAACPLEKILPPPPAPGSPADLADLDTVLHVQARLTVVEAETARAHGQRPWDEFARDVLGPRFNEKNCPAIYRVLAGVRADFEPFLAAARATFPRPRPPNRDARVRLAGERSEIGSYPSAKVWSFGNLAFLLAEIFPGTREAFLEQLRRQGWMRVHGGHHYPSDCSAGLIAAEGLARAFLASPKFQAELPALRAEAARLTGPATAP